MSMHKLIIQRFVLISFVFLAGCSARQPAVPTGTAEAGTLTAPPERIEVSLLYPKTDTEVVMGQSLKVIASITSEQGDPVTDAQVSMRLYDAEGQLLGTVPAQVDEHGTARSDSWAIPHHSKEGMVSLEIEARTVTGEGEASGNFKILNSTSETLLAKYGFWLEAPTLKGIVPFIAAERGDAQNGMIRWGGTLLAQHVLPENWIEVQWRDGDFNLDSAQAVRRFMLEQLGDLGFRPIREFGAIQPVKFKQWDAWKVDARGQFEHDLLEWMVFFAPEVDKTYALGTTLVLPPVGIDPHEALRSSFEVDPSVQANGVAPEPLARLEPGPERVAPPLGERFTGTAEPVTLEWNWYRELGQDEYFEVEIDYNYAETNTTVRYNTRENRFTLPVELYGAPNCNVFNWVVTVKREPAGEAVSYGSLYGYVMWFYPLDEEPPFIPACQNPQF